MQNFCDLDEITSEHFQNDVNDRFYIVIYKRCAPITTIPKGGPDYLMK